MDTFNYPYYFIPFTHTWNIEKPNSGGFAGKKNLKVLQPIYIDVYVRARVWEYVRARM